MVDKRRLSLCPDWSKSSVLNLGSECKGVNLTNFSTFIHIREFSEEEKMLDLAVLFKCNTDGYRTRITSLDRKTHSFNFIYMFLHISFYGAVLKGQR